MGGKRSVDWTKKTLTGEYHWTETVDWLLYKYGSVFDIPVRVLEDAGWHQIELGKEVSIPVQHQVINRGYSTNGGFDHKNYQLVRIDWEYLLERQSRFYASLNWGDDEIKQFHKTAEGWLEERTKFLKQLELEKLAEELASKFGKTPEEVLEILKTQEQEKEAPKPEPTVEEEKETLPTGKLEKLSNEFFIYSEELGGRYKLNKDCFVGFSPLDNIGKEFSFTYTTDNPPKSRQAKGWVLSLTPV